MIKIIDGLVCSKNEFGGMEIMVNEDSSVCCLSVYIFSKWRDFYWQYFNENNRQEAIDKTNLEFNRILAEYNGCI